MKILALSIFLATAVLMTGAGESPTVTFVGHERVADALKQGLARVPLVTAKDFAVEAGQRLGPSDTTEVHEKITHVLYIVDGSATMITGGTMLAAKMKEPGQIRGTGINGGKTQQLTKGDVIVIPAGTPHWWKDVPQSISYYLVNVHIE